MTDKYVQTLLSFLELAKDNSVFCLMFVSVAFVMFGSLSGVWQKKISESKILYRRPWMLRLGLALCAVMLALIPTTIRTPVWLAWYFIAIGYPFAALLTYLSGPNDICLDIYERVYQMRCGWPLFPHKFRGPLDDIDGIKLVRSSQDSSCQLLLVWKQRKSSRSNIILGQFPNKDQANREALTLSKGLGIVFLTLE